MMTIVPLTFGAIIGIAITENKHSFFNFSKVLLNLKSLLIGSIITECFLRFNTEEFKIFNTIIYSLTVDLCFYIFHILQHKIKFVYKHVHKHHHLEIIPQPIDAYIISPIESIILGLTFVIPSLFFSISESSALLVIIWHTLMGILLHGGSKHLNYHMTHHKLFNCNYAGLYPLWDSLFGTFAT